MRKLVSMAVVALLVVSCGAPSKPEEVTQTVEVTRETEVTRSVTGTPSATVTRAQEDLHFDQGVGLLEEGRWVEAIEEFDQVLELAPESTRAYCYRGRAYDRLGEYTRAIVDCDRAIELDPEYAFAYFVRGTAHGGSGDYERATAVIH